MDITPPPIHALYMFEIGVNTPEKFNLLLEFCKENGIYVPPMKKNPFNRIELDTIPKTPTKAFNAFCGSENLTSSGKISMSNVYDFIVRYIDMNNKMNQDGSIELSKDIQSAFNIDSSRIYLHEIPGLATRAFPS